MPNQTEIAARLRFEKLLPFYVTGQISETDRSFMQRFISVTPSAQNALNFTLELGRIVRSTGILRDPSITLRNLLAKFEALHQKDSNGAFAKLRSVGIKSSTPLIIAVVILGGQAVYYGYDKLIRHQGTESAAQNTSRVAVTLKTGATAGSLAVIAEKFGGKIIHSADAEGVTKFFVELIDRTRLQAFIEALVDSGVAESAAVLF